jgi:hypothetical protein
MTGVASDGAGTHTGPGRDRPTPDRTLRWGWSGWLSFAAAVVLSALTVSAGELHADWFSDEMWRANFVRSPDWWDLYRSWDTPTAPGFIWMFRAWGTVFPTGPFALRLCTLATVVVSMVLTARFLLEVLGTRSAGGHGPSSDDATRGVAALKTCAVGACVVAPMLSAFGIHRTFVPYFVETSFAAALLLCCVSLGRRTWAPDALAVVAVLTPVFTIGTVFLLPPVAGYVWWWRRTPVHRAAGTRLIGAFVLAAAVAIVVYATFLRPVKKTTIDDYWASATLRERPGDLPRLLGDTARQMRDGLLGWSNIGLGGVPGVLVWAAIGASGIVGVSTLARRWPPLPALLAGAWVTIAAASAVVGWPMTAERVNLPLFGFVYVAIVFGALRIVAWIARDRSIVAAAAVCVALVWSYPTEKTELFGQAFLRGLTDDLGVVRRSPAETNLVLTYHFGARWYAEDVLVTADTSPKAFRIIPETYTDARVYDRAFVAGVVADLAPGSAVWCVIPFDVGPDATDRACPVPASLRPLVVVRGERSEIRGYRVPPA